MHFWRLEKAGDPTHFLELRVDDCRTYARWGVVDGQSRGQWSTWESAQMAQSEAAKKIRRKTKDGYALVPSAAYEESYDPEAVVLDVWSAPNSATGRPMYSFEPHPTVAGAYLDEGDPFISLLVPNADGTRAALMTLRASSYRDAIVLPVLEHLTEHIDAVMSADSLSFRPLETPAGPFEGVVVISAWASLCALVSPTVTKSVASVFPAYRCEVTGEENIAAAEMRSNTIPTADHGREPMVVCDARFSVVSQRGKRTKSKGGAERFLVETSAQLGRLTARVEEGSAGSWLEIRNYQMKVTRLEKTADGLTLDGRASSGKAPLELLRSFLRE